MSRPDGAIALAATPTRGAGAITTPAFATWIAERLSAYADLHRWLVTNT